MKFSPPLNAVFFTLLFLLPPLGLNGQPDHITGNPYILSFQTKPYDIHRNNQSIAQDTNGLIYLGTSGGIIQYDGHHWNPITREPDPVLTRGKEGHIYAGSFNHFGRIDRQPGSNKFVSLLNPGQNLKKVRSIVPVGGKIYFSSGANLYFFKGEECRKVHEFSSTIRLFQVAGENLYVYVQGGALYQQTNREIERVLDETEIPGPIIELLSLKGRDLAITKNGAILELQAPHAITPLHCGQRFKSRVTITDAMVLDNQLILGSLSKGLIFCRANGRISKVLNETNGLYQRQINKLFLDKDHNLWALHPKGISIIRSSSGIGFFSRRNGLKGTIRSIARFDQSLYLATSRGVYMLEDQKPGHNNQQASFRKMEGITSQAFNFYRADDRLFVTTRQGIFELQQRRARLFYNKYCRQYTSVLQTKQRPRFLLIGLKDGLSLVRYTNGLFIHQGRLKGIEGHIVHLVQDPKGDIWATTRYRGIYRISSLPGVSGQLTYDHFKKEDLFGRSPSWVKPLSLPGGLIFNTPHGIYRYDDNEECFFRDTTYGFARGNPLIHPIARGPGQSLWMNIIMNNPTRRQMLYGIFPRKGEGRRRLNLSLAPVRNFHIHSLHPEGDSLLWIGGNKGLIRLNIDKFQNKQHSSKPLLHQVVASQDSLIHSNFFGNQRGPLPEISYPMNDLRFEFSATNYAGANNMLYRTRLKGYNRKWSDWSTRHRRTFTNLGPGTYHFQLQTQNGHGRSSPVIQYSFVIDPPIYRTWYAYVGYGLLAAGLVWLILWLRSRHFARERQRLERIIDQRTRELREEKDKADRLIERMLPKETAEELKSGVKTRPYFYNKITVLFGDIQGFTRITEETEKHQLIDQLNQYFLQFDQIVEKYNIEKIKTIGDAYMAAGGIPDERQSHPIEVILAAMEMLHHIHQLPEDENDNRWNLRIGINTGPVVAGVIGRDKISYDIWGSTVNMASRMEAFSTPGKINISGNTHALIEDFFICRYRGKIPVKDAGNIDMYYVENLRPHFASDHFGLKPNEQLQLQLQLLRLNDLEEVILEKLENLPSNLYYHNLKHTVDVVTQAELIGQSEGVTRHQMLLLKTAALFHDIGHLVSYDHHEEEGARMAREMLPDYHYTQAQIDEIVRLIMATRMPPQPQTLLEKIICDADLDYLGRSDFVPVAYNLYKELKVRNKVSSFAHWKRVQIEFMRHHSYFTQTARRLREANKEQQLEKIIRESEHHKHA